MADKKPLPDVKTFLSDPQFQGDKDFFFGLFDAYMEKKAEEARQRAANEAPKSLFDEIFGPRS